MNQTEQLHFIEKLIGSPTDEDILAMNIKMEDKDKVYAFQNIDGNWNSIITRKKMYPKLLDLLKSLFV